MGALLTQTHFSEVIVGGLKTACLTRVQMAAQMVGDCLATRGVARTPKLIFTTNGHSIALAATDPVFRRVLAAADMLHADGQPAVLASRLLTSTPIPERTATTDFIHDAATAACEYSLKFFLLGGTEEANRECANVLRRLYPALLIAGRHHGYFSRAQEADICNQINASRADIVWVGLGVPFEQDFSVRNRHRLRAGWLVTAGGCFNFVTGRYARAPRWMQAAGLEWLYRVWKEPRRLFWRYAITNPLALLLLATRTRSISANKPLHDIGPHDAVLESKAA